MANKDMKGSEGWVSEDVIIAALALLDERGTNHTVSVAMGVVREAFNAARRGESVGSYELLQRVLWAHGMVTSESADKRD